MHNVSVHHYNGSIESSSLRTGPRFKAGRILNTKKRPRSDVRELFPDDESA